MSIKTEIWNGHEIRFVETKPGGWGAVATDVFTALGIINTPDAIKRIDPAERGIVSIYSENSPNPKVNVLTEFGVYEAIFSSRKPEAESFQDWVFDIIKALREASGLEGFQVFRMLDKEHQLEAMQVLYDGIDQPAKRDYIKANTIVDKAISTMFGHPKMLKKEEMTPDMLRERQPILDETVQLIVLARKFGLDISVSNAIYTKHCGQATA